MNGQYVAAQVAAVLREHGEAMALIRDGSTLAVKGKRYSLSGQPLAGTMDEAIFSVKISDSEIAGSGNTRAPRKGDTIGGFVVMECDTRKDGAVALLHILTVGGAI